MLWDGTNRYVWGLGLAYSTDVSGAITAVYHGDGLGSTAALSDAAGVAGAATRPVRLVYSERREVGVPMPATRPRN